MSARVVPGTSDSASSPPTAQTQGALAAHRRSGRPAGCSWSASKVSRIENARIRLRTDDVQVLLDLYGCLRTTDRTSRACRRASAGSDGGMPTVMLSVHGVADADQFRSRCGGGPELRGDGRSRAPADRGVRSRTPSECGGCCSPVAAGHARTANSKPGSARQKVLTQEKPLKLHVVHRRVGAPSGQIGDRAGDARASFAICSRSRMAADVTVQIFPAPRASPRAIGRSSRS